MGCFSCCCVADDDDIGRRKKHDDAYVPIPAQVDNFGPSRPPAPTPVVPTGRAQPIAVPAIHLEELKEITKNFSSDALIGEGSYARVYFGVLKDGTKSALKKLDSSKQPDQEFLVQVSAVSRLKHENVVQLVGYCAEGSTRVLAYEYATRGSLHDILHGKKGVKGAQPGPVLSWMQRAKIALSTKSDVYSFGVVLLELLTGRKPVDHTLPRGQQSLVTWATPRLSEDKVRQCVDPRLGDEYPPKAVAKMAAVAALCVQYEGEFRPNMSIVVKALNPLLHSRPGNRPSASSASPAAAAAERSGL
ncbi:unnamed protein product [Miscanthus lutarioriparius]|uniref:Protein kinase domain-containing protein n=1 Tax=Miscanthus lutarioriparius TaxID=422564 RepID=A0A811NV20_9POAL|nr:unnamed protein product [Miscanthus lutarioriparius]